MRDQFPLHGALVPKWRLPALALASAVATALSPAARADVLEIGPDGSVTRVNWQEAPSRAHAAPSDARRAAIAPRLETAGRGVEVSPRLLEAVAWVESRFNQDARSPTGAQGAMQLMPATAAELGVDARDADQNVRGGAAYLRQMLNQFNGDVELALAAYNAGPEAVRRHGGVPPYRETQAYVAAVLSYLAEAAAEEEAP